eukprot:XP_001696406.1 hypothetical protein CHLREDRAFT_167487 [Chlamydomonas reinhardtii]
MPRATTGGSAPEQHENTSPGGIRVYPLRLGNGMRLRSAKMDWNEACPTQMPTAIQAAYNEKTPYRYPVVDLWLHEGLSGWAPVQLRLVYDSEDCYVLKCLRSDADVLGLEEGDSLALLALQPGGPLMVIATCTPTGELKAGGALGGAGGAAAAAYSISQQQQAGGSSEVSLEVTLPSLLTDMGAGGGGAAGVQEPADQQRMTLLYVQAGSDSAGFADGALLRGLPAALLPELPPQGRLLVLPAQSLAAVLLVAEEPLQLEALMQAWGLALDWMKQQRWRQRQAVEVCLPQLVPSTAAASGKPSLAVQWPRVPMWLLAAGPDARGAGDDSSGPVLCCRSEALHVLGLQPGDRLALHPEGPGRVILVVPPSRGNASCSLAGSITQLPTAAATQKSGLQAGGRTSSITFDPQVSAVQLQKAIAESTTAAGGTGGAGVSGAEANCMVVGVQLAPGDAVVPLLVATRRLEAGEHLLLDRGPDWREQVWQLVAALRRMSGGAAVAKVLFGSHEKADQPAGSSEEARGGGARCGDSSAVDASAVGAGAASEEGVLTDARPAAVEVRTTGEVVSGSEGLMVISVAEQQQVYQRPSEAQAEVEADAEAVAAEAGAAADGDGGRVDVKHGVAVIWRFLRGLTR